MSDRKRITPLAALAAAGVLASSCASMDPNDPLFWEGVSLGADLIALAIIMESDCYTEVSAYGYSRRVCGPYRAAPPRRHGHGRPAHPGPHRPPR